MRDRTLNEACEVYDLIAQDIEAKNRKKKSVVTLSSGSAFPVDLNRLRTSERQRRDDIKYLLDNDVIFVTSAGNDAKKKDRDGNLRQNIDRTPAIFEGPDYPMIVVGASDFTGAVADFSQGGDHLTILAPGKGIKCQKKNYLIPATADGTSYCKSNASLRTFLSTYNDCCATFSNCVMGVWIYNAI